MMASSSLKENLLTEATNIFKGPQCLIQTEGKILKVVDNTLQQVLALPVNKKLVVVAIAGPYRSGKSYLLNKCAGERSGFALGSTIESKTKGVWIWVRNFPGYNDRYLVLLDTEGLGDVYKGDQTHDAKLFLIANLSSSILIYNQKDVINEKALNELGYISQMSRFIGIKSDGKGDDSTFDIHFPSHFVYVLRDFFLRLEKNKKPITPDEYLEESLKDNELASESSNKVRQCIRKYFAARKCFKFSMPTDPENMADLDTLEENELKKSFKEDTKKFLDFIFTSAVPKTNLSGTSCHGQLWGKMLQEIVELLETGNIPNIESTMESIDRAESERLLEKGVEAYKTEMGKIKLPTSDMGSFLSQHIACTETASQYIKQGFLLGNRKVKTLLKLKDECEGILPSYIKKNEQISEQLCNELLNNLRQDLDIKIKNKHFFKEDGLVEFNNMMSNIKTQYFSKKLGIKQENVWDNFVLHKLDHKEQIVIHMQKMQKGKNDKEAEEMKRQNEAEQQKIRKEREYYMKKIKDEYEDLIKTVENEMSSIEADIEVKGKEFQETLKKNLKSKLEEIKKKRDNRQKEAKQMRDMGNKAAAKEFENSMPLLNSIIADMENAIKEAEKGLNCCGCGWGDIKSNVSTYVKKVKQHIKDKK